MEREIYTRVDRRGRITSLPRLGWLRAVQAGLVGVLGSASCTRAVASVGGSVDASGMKRVL